MFVSRISLQDSRVDRENNIIHGVSLVSLGEARGHNKIADKTTLEQVRDCAKQYKSGLRVRFNPATFNHGDAGLAGFIPGDTLQLRDKKVTGDLHVYKSYPDKDYLYEIAERAPDNFGLSIEFSGPHEDIDGVIYARCQEIFAATIVDLPAANPTGMFAAKEPYGDVEYADPGYQSDKKKRYPIDTEAHARSAWSYINQSGNASQYSAADLTKVKNRIKSACKKFGIEISEETKQSMDKETLETLGKTIVDGILGGLKPVLLRMQSSGSDDGTAPTEEEMEAAGCTDEMTAEQKQQTVSDWRKRDDAPVTRKTLRKELMSVFRFSGGPPARVSGGITDSDKTSKNGGNFESLVLNFRQRNPDVAEGESVLAVRKQNGEAYNDYCRRGRPQIK